MSNGTKSLQPCPVRPQQNSLVTSQAGLGRQFSLLLVANVCWVLRHLCHHRMINRWGPGSVITLFLAAHRVPETYRHSIHINRVKTELIFLFVSDLICPVWFCDFMNMFLGRWGHVDVNVNSCLSGLCLLVYPILRVLFVLPFHAFSLPPWPSR